MSITASTLGSSPLLLDWSGCASRTPQLSANRRTELATAWQTTLSQLHQEVSGFYQAVQNPELSQVQASVELAKQFLARPEIEHCLFIGIGGSSLGPMCLLDALKHRAQSRIQFHFFENPDPIDWNYRIQKLDPKKTLVCVVTKSGTTYETLSLFMLAWDWLKRALGAAAAAKQTVAITDPQKGELREFAQLQNIATLSIAPSVGGRYSVFTPVGLFAGALAGLNMDAFLLGAKKVRDACEKTTAEKNVWLEWAYQLTALQIQNPIHVMMPYSTSLRLLANWWVQLWAESLGKNGKGFTAVPSLGAIDQHSMLQLLRDGPNDKVIWFVNVMNFESRAVVPSVDFKVKSFDLLEKQELGNILDTEFRAIQKVMSNQRRPHLQLQVNSISEESMGALFFTLCTLTAYIGTVLGVNPFDQPGVEEGKIYIRETLTKNKEAAQREGESEIHRLRRHQES